MLEKTTISATKQIRFCLNIFAGLAVPGKTLIVYL